jgi:hypothetical protein
LVEFVLIDGVVAIITRAAIILIKNTKWFKLR